MTERERVLRFDVSILESNYQTIQHAHIHLCHTNPANIHDKFQRGKLNLIKKRHRVIKPDLIAQCTFMLH